MSFTILEFKDGVQLVPSCWLVDGQDKCFFPKFLSLQRITKSIEEQEKPESNWRVYNVKRIFGTAATYKQGLRKLNLATRFLEIDDEVESFGEPKKIKLSNHEQCTGELTEECPCCKKIQSPLQISKYVSHDHSVQVSHSGAESSHLFSKAYLINSDLSSSTIKKENHESFDCQKHLEIFKKKVFHRLDGMLEAINSMNKNTENNMNEKLKSIDKINEKIETFEKELEKLKEGKYSYNTFDDAVENENIFPLSCIETLEQFESDLKDKDYFAKMVNYFGRIGGPKNNLASNILTKMLSNELAKECDWRGLNKKKAFSKLRLNLLILEAVQKHCPLAKKHEVYNTISRWLVCTKMKLEGREERKRKSLPAKLE